MRNDLGSPDTGKLGITVVAQDTRTRINNRRQSKALLRNYGTGRFCADLIELEKKLRIHLEPSSKIVGMFNGDSAFPF
jgi:hypothetical protein